MSETIPNGIDDAQPPAEPEACGVCYPHPAHRANLCMHCLCSHEGTTGHYHQELAKARAPLLSVAELLTLAEELDAMEDDLTTWEAEFLDSVLRRLRGGAELSEKQARVLREMHSRYLER